MKTVGLILIIIFHNIALAEIIKDIKHIGINHSSKKKINQLISIKKQEKLNIKKIDDSLKNLFRTGNFLTINVDYSNQGVFNFYF